MRGTAIKDKPEGHVTPTLRDRNFPGSTRRPRSPVVSGAIREVSSSSRHATPSPRRKASVIKKSKSSPESAAQGPERGGHTLVRRKVVSANVDEADDLDLSAAASMGIAGMASPPAQAAMDDTGGLNLEQALSLLRAEREAYLELQDHAFTDTVLLRKHLQNEEQECRGSTERIPQLDRWTAMSELQAQRLKTKYHSDISQKDTLIAELEQKSKILEQQVANADVELHGLRDRYKQEETAVVHLKGALAGSEAIRSELVERLSDNARLDAHREHSMRQAMDELNRSITGFRESELESESEQRKIFLGRAQELAGVEHRVVEQVALISHAEQRMNEEYAVMCQSKQHADAALQQEIDQLVGERRRSRLEFMEETKEAGALRREMLRKDERIMQLQRSLEQTNSASSVSSWQQINSPDDGEKKKLRDAVDSWQIACVKLEQMNESLPEQSADQESYVEQLNGALEEKDEELKRKTKDILKPTAAVATRKSHWGDSGRDLLSGVLCFTPIRLLMLL